MEQLLCIRFDGSGTPILEAIAPLDVWGVQNLTAFAGGLAFSGSPLGEFIRVRSTGSNPATDTPRVLLSSQFGPGVFSDLTVAEGLAGTENLFFLQYTADRQATASDQLGGTRSERSSVDDAGDVRLRH